jgi:hypothetical protein
MSRQPPAIDIVLTERGGRDDGDTQRITLGPEDSMSVDDRDTREGKAGPFLHVTWEPPSKSLTGRLTVHVEIRRLDEEWDGEEEPPSVRVREEFRDPED